jgi:ABC-type oligopeptide transport system substrate-binding subunit/DNA-binding SARP family transcriptional activator
MELCYSEQSLKKPATLKSQSLLAYLVMHNGILQSRERLASMFWGEWPADKARRNLSTALWRIRRCFPIEVLSSDPHSVCFNFPENYDFDVENFEELIEKGDIASLEEAGKLYRGDFLDGFYDDWVVNTRYRLETAYFSTLSRLMELQATAGEHQACLEAALRLIELDPLREDAHRYVMRALTLLGQRDRALAQYEHCRQVLKNELDIEPAIETVELFQDIQKKLIAPLKDVEGHTIADFPSETAVLPSLPSGGRDPWGVFAISRMVGREAEMEILEQCWKRTMTGQGNFMLLSGEAGVGKSRLAFEYRQRLHARGVTTSVSRCYEFESTLPYQPIIEAMRNTFRGQKVGILQDMPSWALGGLSDLMPEIAEQYPELMPLIQRQEEQKQTRLFESMLCLLTHLVRNGPVLLVVEDLHWAGASTLELLHYLIRNLTNSPVFILGTYRSEALEKDHLLTRFESKLAQEGLIRNITLKRLSENAVLEMIDEASGSREAVIPLARRLYQESDGNPFYLIEMIKELFEAEIITFQERTWTGDFQAASQQELPLPPSISRAIQRRVERLDKDCQDILETTAILGVEFDHAVLEIISKAEEEHLLEMLDDLLRYQLIEECGPEGTKDYQFVHQKIQEVVYESIPFRKRAFLHKRIGEELELLFKSGKTSLAGELAHHLLKAQQTDHQLASKAIFYLNEAGNQARLLYAHQEAADYYNQALTLCRQIEDQEGAARTLMKLGATYHGTFAYELARQAFDESFALFRHTAWAAPIHLSTAPHALRYWSPTEPTTLDPVKCIDICVGKIIYQLFRGAVTLTPDLDAFPSLFQSWEISPDGKSYTFHLLQDACWSDGHPLTAGDFEFAWKRALDPAVNSIHADMFFILKGARDYHQGLSPNPDQVGIRVLDDYTLLAELEEPEGYFLHLLTHTEAFPLPRHILRGHSGLGENFWGSQSEFVTNGAFLLRSWEPGKVLTLERNPNYAAIYKGNLEEARVYFMDWSEALEHYENGKLDVLDLTYTAKEQRTTLYRCFPDEYFSTPLQAAMFALLNPEGPPFADARVRQAFAQAIDKRLLVQAVIEGDPADGGVIPPGIPGHSPDLGHPYNPRKGRDLLAQAGFPDGKGFPPLRAYAQANPRYTLLNNELARQWRQNLGVEVEWIWFPTEAFFTQTVQDVPDLICFGLAAESPDPKYFIHKGFFPYLRSELIPGYLEQLRDSRQIQNPAEQLASYQAIDIALVEQAAIIPLVYPRFHMLIQPWVKGFPLTSSSHGEWKDVIIEPHD